MSSIAITPQEYIDALQEERKAVVNELRKVLLHYLPEGFQEVMSYGMIGYVVPHSLYSAGYHCNAKLPLPFINIASQKNFIVLYHMGLYADAALLDWFVSKYKKENEAKLDMGKSCIRFEKWEQIPYRLIGELASKMTPQQWIQLYEKQFKK